MKQKHISAAVSPIGSQEKCSKLMSYWLTCNVKRTLLKMQTDDCFTITRSRRNGASYLSQLVNTQMRAKSSILTCQEMKNTAGKTLLS